MERALKKIGHWQLLAVLLVALALCAGMSGVQAAGQPAPAALSNANFLFQSPPPIPPENDNLLAAKVIGGLPYSDEVNTVAATGEPGEPGGCYGSYYPSRSVWYVFSPSERVLVRANMDGSSFGDTVFTIYQATDPIDGFEDLWGSVTCVAYGGTAQFWAEPGVSYYFQAMDAGGGGGSLRFNLDQYLAPVNDQFDDATTINALPYDSGQVDTTAATMEAGEPKPSCAQGYDIRQTIWYAFTPSTTQLLTSYVDGCGPFQAVYAGTSLSDLTEVACRAWSGNMSFAAEAGATYFFQRGELYSCDSYTYARFSLDVAPPPYVDFYYSPWDPSIYDTVWFNSSCWDPAGIGIEKQKWDLGDGTAAEECCPSHRYASDADYTATLTCSTPDGRSATSAKVIPVSTHDVAIAKLTVPQSAKAGQTRQISVEVKNTRYEEPVRVELYRSTPWGFEQTGSLTQVVPVRGGNRTTTFAFSYTFTSADAAIGKVTFRAVANLQEHRDALPADNEAISSPTKVSR
jgi:hypothetical protein